MVKIDILFSEGKVSRISELELERYLNFFENSYKDNLKHSAASRKRFPRWSIISGYYAMHDITKLLLAKRFRLKIELEVHATTIKILRELIRNKELISLMDKGYREFISLANDLAQAKTERVNVQYYTGTEFMRKEYLRRAREFYGDIVLKYLQKMKVLLQ